MTETEYRGPTLNTLFFPATPGSMWAQYFQDAGYRFCDLYGEPWIKNIKSWR